MIKTIRIDSRGFFWDADLGKYVEDIDHEYEHLWGNQANATEHFSRAELSALLHDDSALSEADALTDEDIDDGSLDLYEARELEDIDADDAEEALYTVRSDGYTQPARDVDTQILAAAITPLLETYEPQVGQTQHVYALKPQPMLRFSTPREEGGALTYHARTDRPAGIFQPARFLLPGDSLVLRIKGQQGNTEVVRLTPCLGVSYYKLPANSDIELTFEARPTLNAPAGFRPRFDPLPAPVLPPAQVDLTIHAAWVAELPDQHPKNELNPIAIANGLNANVGLFQVPDGARWVFTGRLSIPNQIVVELADFPDPAAAEFNYVEPIGFCQLELAIQSYEYLIGSATGVRLRGALGGNQSALVRVWA